jgi:hypothetical protein
MKFHRVQSLSFLFFFCLFDIKLWPVTPLAWLRCLTSHHEISLFVLSLRPKTVAWLKARCWLHLSLAPKWNEPYRILFGQQREKGPATVDDWTEARRDFSFYFPIRWKSNRKEKYICTKLEKPFLENIGISNSNIIIAGPASSFWLLMAAVVT